MLGQVYNACWSGFDRKLRGQYYMPRDIISLIWDLIDISPVAGNAEAENRQPYVLDIATGSGGFLVGPDALIELLYQDAVEIYERARREVTIPRKDGRTQKYAANRYKQQIDKAHAEHRLVAAISQIVGRLTQGFGHLENAGRDDLMVETLVLDASKPYHQLFPAATVEMARQRMAQYRARHPKPST